MNYLDPKDGVVRKQDFWFHYVTITGLIENNQTGKVVLEVSTWGGKATLKFNELFDQWSKGSMLDILTQPGMMCFDVD